MLNILYRRTEEKYVLVLDNPILAIWLFVHRKVCVSEGPTNVSPLYWEYKSKFRCSSIYFCSLKEPMIN